MINDSSNRYWVNDGTKVNLGEWDYMYYIQVHDKIIRWLKSHPDKSKYAWNKRECSIIFENPKMAILFLLTWS